MLCWVFVYNLSPLTYHRFLPVFIPFAYFCSVPVCYSLICPPPPPTRSLCCSFSCHVSFVRRFRVPPTHDPSFTLHDLTWKSYPTSPGTMACVEVQIFTNKHKGCGIITQEMEVNKAHELRFVEENTVKRKSAQPNPRTDGTQPALYVPIDDEQHQGPSPA